MGIRRKPKKKYTGENDMQAFAEEFLDGPCWVCGKLAKHCFGGRLQIHHIASRASKNCHHRSNLFAVCAYDHMEVIPSMPIQKQILIKIHFDPCFDEVKFLEIRKAKNGRIDF